MSTKHFENYGQASRAALQAMELRVTTADLRRKDYDPAWIYLNRIGEKVRILTVTDAIGNGGTIRNAIKITWNPDRYALDDVRGYVKRRLRLIMEHAQHGTCHQAIRCSDIVEVLAGAHEAPAARTGYLTSNAAILYTDTATWAAKQAALIG
jgi:hypothetical protein